jgi:hypothetical protein
MVMRILGIVCVAAGAILLAYNHASARDAVATTETLKTTTRTLGVLSEIVFSALTIIDLLQGVKVPRRHSRSNKPGNTSHAYQGKWHGLGTSGLLTTEEAITEDDLW